jgi:lipopolysaccharide transport system permease protein
MILYQKEPWQTLANPFAIARNLHRHRTLLWRFTWRNIELQHKGSTLGLLWSVLSPLLMFGAYAFVFIAIFKGRFGIVPTETKVDYAIGLFLSLSLLQLIQETMTLAPLVVVQHPSYVKKVVFPLEILPVAAFGAALFRCSVSLALVIVAIAIVGPGLAVTACWLPVIVALLAMFTNGSRVALSSTWCIPSRYRPTDEFCSGDPDVLEWGILFPKCNSSRIWIPKI